jgi:hypothetical protein
MCFRRFCDINIIGKQDLEESHPCLKNQKYKFISTPIDIPKFDEEELQFEEEYS